MNTDTWLSELQAKRQRFVDSVRENGFENGVWQSTVEKYADPVHFIFELIQNAEDQGAKLAQFSLRDDLIIFDHDGAPFSRDDIERITGWGQSDKPNQANKIGRFGIGFKSVFVVTDSPEIYIKRETADSIPSIRIRDLFVPEKIAEDPKCSLSPDYDCATRFVLRLRPLEAKQFSKHIRERFETFSADVLLFLNSLKRVEWLAEGVSGVCERADRDGIRTIRTTLNPSSELEKQTKKRFLVFERPVVVPNTEREQTVKLGFALDTDGKVIEEESEPPVHVFFPTKERLGLKFRIHAPFLLSDNRENIKQGIEENENNLLAVECAKLLREAIREVKQRNKLTVSFLSILPFSRSKFSPDSILSPLFDATFSCLFNDSILPCRDDTFCKWKEARFTEDARLMDLVTDRFLTEISSKDHRLRWLHKEFGRPENQQLLSFLKNDIASELGRRDDSAWYWADAVSIELDCSEVALDFSYSFLEARADAWVEELYEYLDKQDIAAWKPTRGELWRCPIIRLTGRKHVAAFQEDKTPNAFLPCDAVGFPTVEPAVLKTEAALSFIKRIGIGLPDLTAQILKVIFPKYSALKAYQVSPEEHRNDLEQVCNFAEKSSGANLEVVLKALEQITFFYARNVASGKCAFQHRNDVYLGSPELDVFLAGSERAWILHEDYSKWTEILRKRFKVADSARVTFQPDKDGYVILANGHGNHQRGVSKFDPNADVDGLVHSLKSPSIEKAKFIWNRVLVTHAFLIKGEVEESRRATYGDSKRTTKTSVFGKKLIESQWLPKSGGGWAMPKELSLEDLPPDFIRNHEVAANLGMKQSLMTALAAQKNVSVRLIQQMFDMAEREPEKLERMLAASSAPKATETPSSPVENDNGSEVYPSPTQRPTLMIEKLKAAILAPGNTARSATPSPLITVRNPERYQRELQSQLKERQENERPQERRKAMKLRRVWEDASKEVREYFGQWYDGRCQITGETFAKRNGKHYFEVWYFISTHEAEWLDHPGNALCVCPEIWAKLEYGALESDPDAVIAQILRWKPAAAGGTDEPTLKLKLCGEEVEIRYAVPHMMRLQVLVAGMTSSATDAATDPESTQPPGAGDAANVIQVQEPVTVAEFAALRGQKPFQVIKALMELGIFPAQKDALSRKNIERLAAKFGFAVRFIRPAVDR